MFNKIYGNILFKHNTKDLYLTINNIAKKSFEDVLNTLKLYNVKCTFFLVGSSVNYLNRKLIVNAIKEGYHFANHGMDKWSHSLLSKEKLSEEIELCQKIISKLYKEAGVELPIVKYYRPASGFVNGYIYNYAKDNNYQITLGNIYPMDPALPLPYLFSKFILYRIKHGSIIILHDRSWTVNTLNLILPEILKKYNIVPLC